MSAAMSLTLPALAPARLAHLGSVAGTSAAQRQLREAAAQELTLRRIEAFEAIMSARRKVAEAGRAAALVRLQSRYLAQLQHRLAWQRLPGGTPHPPLDISQQQLRDARKAAIRARAAAFRRAREADRAVLEAQRRCQGVEWPPGEGVWRHEHSISELVERLTVAVQPTEQLLCPYPRRVQAPARSGPALELRR